MSWSNLTNDQLLVADTGPLLALARVDFLEHLSRLFDSVFITQSVLSECLVKPERLDAKLIQEALESGWFIAVPDPLISPSLNLLDCGEQTVLEFALQNNAVVLIDEKLGRKVAKEHGLKIIGVLGILLLAKRKGLISAIKPSLSKLISSGYFLSESLVITILELANE
ncbi:MAG TPA: DUF3368 domain-containing protein [Cellvibrio sp.]|nr:DUF3368 domain-containing protein [Cellvibrio sp.]